MNEMGGRARVALWILLGVVLVAPQGLRALIDDETLAEEFMKELDYRYSQECNLEMLARWDYITDVTNELKEEAANEAAVIYMTFESEAADSCSEYEYSGFVNMELYRRFRFLSKKGPGALQPDELSEYKTLQANMETIYSTATICDYHNQTKCDLILEPDIVTVMASSEDWDELLYTWEQWRENTGKKMREDFVRFVELSNEAATLDGFSDTGSYWLNAYTVDEREAEEWTDGVTLDQQHFRVMVDAVWQEVSERLYKKLHAYVRMRLQEVYPGKIDPTGPIPSHILGDMWAQDWSNIARHVMPFPEMPTFDVTDSMVENGWDIDRMFHAAEDFFRSIGLFDMTQTFWDKSVVNQTAWGKTMVCHASAEDFCLGPEGEDYRIKMCTEVNMIDLITVHHEMGHIEYFMAYKNQPLVFRDSANPGFHEAIGDLIALSMSTPKHLEDVLGLTPTPAKVPDPRYTDDEKRDLNFLMKMALEKIAFLPFGYLIDMYRWGVFDGSIPIDELNAGWWNLRESLQGVTPPAGQRGEEFFDPGAKYHVPANVPYIRYFVSFIVQFQFHAQLCQAAGHTGPLHTCDIYNNTDAGGILRSALEKGFSEPWPKVLSELGGSQNMESQHIINYFEPLLTYLDQELLEAEQCIGWGEECFAPVPMADHSVTLTQDPRDNETAAHQAMKEMNTDMTNLVKNATLVDWTYYTDVTTANADASNEAWLLVKNAFGEWHKKVIEGYDYQNFEDYLRRQFELQKNLGTSALTEEDFTELNKIIKHMTTTYTSRVCRMGDDCDKKKDDLSIDQLEDMMAVESNYDVLRYYWETWRDVSGKMMKDDYVDYIRLLNKAAGLNEFSDAGEMWLQPYSDTGYNATEFVDDIEKLWNATKPLYEKLHAYVRDKLKSIYENDNKEEQFIPAHILGNMWAESWENIYERVKPYNVNITDISDDLKSQIQDVKEMFCLSENFFASLGMYNMTEDFWINSVSEHPSGKEFICQASAWDFYDTEDVPDGGRFRIKMCADKTQEDFIVIHQQMGHTEYQMSYSNLPDSPLVFRDAANPGFREAIGGTISLSVSTLDHLKKVSNALKSNTQFCNTTFTLEDFATQQAQHETDQEKIQINFLMKEALSKIASLPYAYILDKWRWDLFSNNNEDTDFNRKWWKYRLNVQGICPPVQRYPSSDFDAGSKYHVATNVPYIRYFVAGILQFQFHRRLCNVAHQKEILNCNIYGSKDAGDTLLKMLQNGASVGWRKQLKDFLGSDTGMSAEDILEYFHPLEVYLDNYINNASLVVGWNLDSVDKYMKDELVDIPATVPIVVGVVLALMVVIVIVAYIVGRTRQKKKEKMEERGSHSREQVEMAVNGEGSVHHDSSPSEKHNP